MSNLTIAIVSLLILILAACGPSSEELAATSAAETAAAATSTPTSTPVPTATPTPTPVPYDLSIIVTGEEDTPLVGAEVHIEEIEGEDGIQLSDEVGQVFWYDIPGGTVNLTVSAQGYFPSDVSEVIDRGITQLTINLERDPHGLLLDGVCAPGQKVLYIEDFQDGEAQGWSEEIKMRTMGWDIIPHPDSQGNLVLVNNHNYGAGAMLENVPFGPAVWHLQFMTDGKQIIRLEWHWKYDYTDETGYVENSAYYARFEQPNTLVIDRQKGESDVGLFGLTPFSIKKGEWQTVDISTFEGRFEFWFNDQILVSYKDPDPLPAGDIVIGLDEVVGDEQVLYFDNFVVCELTEPYTPREENE
jgi:hypothetical protein